MCNMEKKTKNPQTLLAMTHTEIQQYIIRMTEIIQSMTQQDGGIR